MTNCPEWNLLLQADLDGELSAAEAARLAAHEEGCAECTAMRGRLLTLSARVAQEVPRYEAPAALRAALQAAASPEPTPQTAPVLPFRPRKRRWTREAIGFLAGAALAASIAFVVTPGPGSNPAEDIVDDHIRALQPGHLVDVESSEHHTVKPWFAGRLDFAPPVPQFEQYPLIGGRLDYTAGHTMAALAYRAGKHIVDVFIRPADANAKPRSGTREGYHYICWLQGGMVIWVVSDMDPAELEKFVQSWKSV